MAERSSIASEGENSMAWVFSICIFSKYQSNNVKTIKEQNETEREKCGGIYHRSSGPIEVAVVYIIFSIEQILEQSS